MTKDKAFAAIEVALYPAADLYCASGVDRAAREKFLEADLLASLCEPYEMLVHELAFHPGSSKAKKPVRVYCVASRSGSRLFYHPATHKFLGAHGQTSLGIARQAVSGSPLACWAGTITVASRV